AYYVVVVLLFAVHTSYPHFIFVRARHLVNFSFFFFNDPASPEFYTLSLHDALPIYCPVRVDVATYKAEFLSHYYAGRLRSSATRSEEHTSELQSPYDLVCRLLLEKKKKKSVTVDIQSMKQAHYPLRLRSSLHHVSTR